MDLLARREHSFRELLEKLGRRFSDTALVQQEVERLSAETLQSDARFAETYVHSRAQRLYGPQRIRMELRERGISSELIAVAMSDSAIDWRDNLEKLARQRFGRNPPVDYSERAKRMRFLQQRGFDAEQVRNVVSGLDF